MNKIDSFLKNCVVGFDRIVIPGLIPSGLSEKTIQFLLEENLNPPDGLFRLEGKVQHLRDLKGSVEISRGFVVAGIAFVVSALALSIFGVYILAIPICLVGVAAILGSLRLHSLYDTSEIDQDVKDIESDAALIGEWLKEIDAKQKQNNLSDESVVALKEASAFGLYRLEYTSATLK